MPFRTGLTGLQDFLPRGGFNRLDRFNQFDKTGQNQDREILKPTREDVPLPQNNRLWSALAGIIAKNMRD